MKLVSLAIIIISFLNCTSVNTIDFNVDNIHDIVTLCAGDFLNILSWNVLLQGLLKSYKELSKFQVIQK